MSANGCDKMVLESLFPAKKIINKPIDMLLMSFVVSIVCTLSAYFIFPAYAGIIAPLLVTAAMTPVILRIFGIEEELVRKEAEKKINVGFFDRHGETIQLFSLFFIGNFLAFFLIALLSPADFAATSFSPQLEDIKRIRGAASAEISGNAVEDSFLNMITINNLKVMGFSFLLSFLFSTGALFILSWNASILAVFFAAILRRGEFEAFLSTTIGIIPHAPVEMLAYFLAGIAGGILSVGIIREKFGTKEFNLVARDSLILLGLGIASVLLGAYLEVYV